MASKFFTPKPDKNIIGKEKYWSFSLINLAAKIFKYNISDQN